MKATFPSNFGHPLETTEAPFSAKALLDELPSWHPPQPSTLLQQTNLDQQPLPKLCCPCLVLFSVEKPIEELEFSDTLPAFGSRFESSDQTHTHTNVVTLLWPTFMLLTNAFNALHSHLAAIRFRCQLLGWHLPSSVHGHCLVYLMPGTAKATFLG